MNPTLISKAVLDDELKGLLTMFPVSVEARAKIKITRGQAELLPVSSSLLVLLSWRATRRLASATSPTASRSTGMAETQAIAKAMVAKNFMVNGGLRYNWWTVELLSCWTIGLEMSVEDC